MDSQESPQKLYDICIVTLATAEPEFCRTQELELVQVEYKTAIAGQCLPQVLIHLIMSRTTPRVILIFFKPGAYDSNNYRTYDTKQLIYIISLGYIIIYINTPSV